MIQYYDDFADAFFEATVHVDMHSLYERFLTGVPKNGTILDAGCGSGRDALYFRQSGYAVQAFDASIEMCRRASAHVGLPVLQLDFLEMRWQETFDGIWACASLLHVARAQLPAVFTRLAAALKPGSMLYVSFKYGDAEREKDGRRFTDMNEELLAELVQFEPRLSICETWKSSDLRPGRSELWLNGLIQKA